MLKRDCTHFPGDRPCSFHKLNGTVCDSCEHYAPLGRRVLIIKLDALGDVLRTTCILPAVKRKLPDAHVTWLTKANALPLFENNPFVDRVLDVHSTEAITMLSVEQFDIVLQPDAAKFSASLASMVQAEHKFGYSLRPNGLLEAKNAVADSWLEHGAFDTLKKANTRTYQRWIYDILELPDPIESIQLHLSSKEVSYAQQFVRENGLETFSQIVGLNTGAGGRWKYKKWTEAGYAALVESLVQQKIGVVLYGGPEEHERNKALARLPGVIDTGTNNTLREFFAKLSVCDVVVTGDTMALHAATALEIPTVALFGPTSIHEIETYGIISKLAPEMDCLCCYLMDCGKDVTCMDSIHVSEVLQEVEQLLLTKQIGTSL